MMIKEAAGLDACAFKFLDSFPAFIMNYDCKDCMESWFCIWLFAAEMLIHHA